MLVGFATRLVLIATVAGTLGAFLIEGRREQDRDGERLASVLAKGNDPM